MMQAYVATKFLSLVSLLGFCFFTLAVVLMHFVRAGLDPIRHTISEYALGADGWILDMALIALGLAAVALGCALSTFPARRKSGAFKVGVLCLFAFGLCSVVGGIFVTDPIPPVDGPSLHGLIHSAAAVVGFPIFGVGSLLCSWDMAPIGQEGRVIARALKSMAVASVASVVLFVIVLMDVIRDGPITRALHGLQLQGLLERVLVVFVIAWLASVAISLYSTVPSRPTYPDRIGGSE
jgi:hypothetical protein